MNIINNCVGANGEKALKNIWARVEEMFPGRNVARQAGCAGRACACCAAYPRCHSVTCKNRPIHLRYSTTSYYAVVLSCLSNPCSMRASLQVLPATTTHTPRGPGRCASVVP